MRIIEPSFEILEQLPGLDGVYKQIERAGRICYKSEDRITEDSAKEFVERMVNSKHYAMLEHGTVYLMVPCGSQYSLGFGNDKYSEVIKPIDPNGKNGEVLFYVTTNYRVIVENNWFGCLQYMCEPTTRHAKRATVIFHTQIAISREFNRHRVDSIAESSTRYCNYSKNKFGNELSVNCPEWVDEVYTDDLNKRFKAMCQWIADGAEQENMSDIDWWHFGNLATEAAYMNLVRLGKKPQEARAILPLDTNTDLVHTAFVKDWRHFFDLRALDKTGPAHPDAKKIARPLYEVFRDKHII